MITTADYHSTVVALLLETRKQQQSVCTEMLGTITSTKPCMQHYNRIRNYVLNGCWQQCFTYIHTYMMMEITTSMNFLRQ